jgi:nucleoside-diphosphate-sugar epimerase
LHVRDVARAFDTVLHKGVVGEVYNIGTQKERSVLDVVSAIADHMKIDKAKVKHVEDRAFNDQRCAPSVPQRLAAHFATLAKLRKGHIHKAPCCVCAVAQLRDNSTLLSSWFHHAFQAPTAH